MDPEYDPSHKTSSISSTNSWDTVPSMTASSICDMDSPALRDQTTFDDYSFSGNGVGLSLPFETMGQDNQKSFNHFLDNFFTDDKSNTPIFLQQSLPQQPVLPINDRPSQPTTTTDDDRPARDLLTEDEKRANHIASEQKRRNAIRTGFKEMTEIIPTLKNINNSKSTILFKAVEYIRHLDKRNRGLRDKLNNLQVRLQVETRMGQTKDYHRRNTYPYEQHHPSKKSRSTLPPEAIAALLAHKNQQKQLAQLQEQLRYQQALLAKHNIHEAPRSSFDSSSWPSFNIPADDDFGLRP